MEYTLRSSLDLSEVKELKRDEPLRVAAVRDGRVLGSRLIDLAKAKSVDKLDVDVPFDLPPGESPAGVELRIGPDAPEAILPHYDALAVRPSQEQLAKAKPGAVLDLGVQKVSDAIYIGWLRNCHSYTFTGRLVRQVVRGGTVCNQPVPGAVVEAYDVDRFFFWLRKTLITATTTDANGYFTMTFRWCCWRWWFYPYLGWYIDQTQWEQLHELLQRFRRLVPKVPIPVDPNPPDPPVLLRLAQTLDQLDPQARGKAAPFPGDVITPQPGLALQPLARPAVKLTAEATKLLADIRAFYPWWWWQGTDCYPDVLFRATQAAAGGAVIYDEPYSDTRWNVAPSSSPVDVGNLNANSSAVAVDNCPQDIPDGDCFKFTDVGLVQVPSIGSVVTGGPLAGYAFPGSSDEAFGGTLNLYGGFGRVTITNSASFVDYYKLQVAPWNGNPATLPADGAFNDIPYARLGRLGRSYWGVVDAGTPGAHEDWIPYDFGPDTSSGSTQGLYRTVESFQREFEAAHGGPPGPWGWLWTQAQWIANVDTSYLPDGLAVLRLVGYRQAGGTLTSRVMLNCTLPPAPQTVELLPLALDNTRLNDVKILSLDINGATQPNAVCQDLVLKAGDVVTVHFRANDPRNHLNDFSLVEVHRLDCAVSLLNASLAGEPSSTVGVSNYPAYIAAVGPAVRPSWGGGAYKVDLVVGAPPPASAACNDCGYDRPYFPFAGAYDIRLHAWKRVTNGYGLIFDNESNMLVVVKRTDAP